MIGNKKIICIIPARLKSTRFPGKVLAPLGGKPLIQRTWEAACRVPFFDEVALAIDSQEVASIAESFGARYFFTAETCQNGTERLIELQQKNLLQGDIWVNWQGDEPFLSLRAIQDLLQSCETESADVWTLKQELEFDKVSDPNLCKVVCDSKGHALYFSRSPIPYHRDGGKVAKYFKHIGLYAYAENALKKISSMKSCEIEESEMLEQLRFLHYGLKIKVHETQESSIGIDLLEHLILAEKHLKSEILFSI